MKEMDTNRRFAVGVVGATESEGALVSIQIGGAEMWFPWDTALTMAKMLEAAAYQIRPDQEPEADHA